MSSSVYDAVVVGSGASGGWACKRLSEAGLTVALVDAGRQQSDSNFREHEPLFRVKYHNMAPQVLQRRRPVQTGVADEFNSAWFADDLDEPYTTPEGMPFSWLARMRITGGRTNVWGRHCYRLSDLDLAAASHDGYGMDWPLRYRDLEPYYDLVEEYVGISGEAEGLPQLPDGRYQPPMPLLPQESWLRQRMREKLGWTLTPGRLANLTRGLNGRAPCHYCGTCGRGCITHSYFNSYFTTVADALRTGRCTHIPNAMVYQVETNAAGDRATGVIYVDRETRALHRVRGRAVVLCAQAQESVRILFNSATPRHPAGLGNSNGVLGHYLMDHVAVGGGASGEFPQFPMTPKLSAPSRPGGFYIPRFQNLGDGRKWPFLRGFGFQTWGNPPYYLHTPDFSAPGYGTAYRQAILQPRPSRISLYGFGECLPYRENRVEIDPEVTDTYGIPVLRIRMKYRENERLMMRAMAETAAEILEAAGARNIETSVHYDRTPGSGIHEVGIARMGTSPKTSVLNQFQQSHDVRNLFVMDGSGFTSTASQNPTLTIMTLAVRSCDFLKEQMRRGEL